MASSFAPFDSRVHMEKARDLPFSYYSSPAYLDYCAYLLPRDEAELIVWQDDKYRHEFPAIYTPQKPQYWERLLVGCATQEDIDAMKQQNIPVQVRSTLGIEFFYKTEDFINPKKDLRSRIRQFQKKYPNAKIVTEYPIEKIDEFVAYWMKQRERPKDNTEESMRFFQFCKKNLQKYDIKQVYVEIDGKLAGLAWAVAHSADKWVGLQLKVDYKIKGLSRFLMVERAKLFPDRSAFTLGSAGEPGTEQYKRELGPSHTVTWYSIETGSKTTSA